MPCSSLCLHSGSHFYEMFNSLICLGLHVWSSLFAMHMWQDTYFRNVRLNLPFRAQEDLMHFSAVQICLLSVPFIHFSHTKLFSVSRVTHSPPTLFVLPKTVVALQENRHSCPGHLPEATLWPKSIARTAYVLILAACLTNGKVLFNWVSTFVTGPLL